MYSNKTTSVSDNTTFPNVPTTSVTVQSNSNVTSAQHHSSNDDEVTGKVIAALITISGLVAIIVLAYCYLKRSGKLDRLFCHKYTRTRRSSTSSSRRALEDNEIMDQPRSKSAQRQEEMFTIDDFEEANGEVTEGKEEYYYDEVFGQSQFEDEATNSAMRELYSTRAPGEENDEEMLDLDFETLGIKIENTNPPKRRSK